MPKPRSTYKRRLSNHNPFIPVNCPSTSKYLSRLNCVPDGQEDTSESQITTRKEDVRALSPISQRAKSDVVDLTKDSEYEATIDPGNGITASIDLTVESDSETSDQRRGVAGLPLPRLFDDDVDFTSSQALANREKQLFVSKPAELARSESDHDSEEFQDKELESELRTDELESHCASEDELEDDLDEELQESDEEFEDDSGKNYETDSSDVICRPECNDATAATRKYSSKPSRSPAGSRRYNSGRYSSKEKALVLRGVEKYGRKWELISDKMYNKGLRRTAASLRDFYRSTFEKKRRAGITKNKPRRRDSTKRKRPTSHRRRFAGPVA